MNKKQLIVAAVVTALSVSAANASNISGFSQTSGTFNIDPAKVNGDVGYRAYDNFNLSKGDIANLIYRYKSGTANARDIETFVNLVQNKVDINGIVNSVRDGSFHPGHAVFISPNGMAVGASGVINVGTLSVATPTSSEFERLKSDYTSSNFVNINQISQLKHTGNAPITVDGYIFAKNGVDLPGSNISVAGNIVNGIKNQSVMSSLSQAEALFNQLVNTDGTIKANSSAINSDGSLVFLHQTGSQGGINVSGNIVNLTQGTSKNGSVAITNNGANGLTMTGNVAANGKLSLYNKSGDMLVAGNLNNKNGELSVTNGAKASDLTINSNSVINNLTGDVNIINNGKGALVSNGSVAAAKKLSFVNKEGKEMAIAGNSQAKTIRIINRGEGLAFEGTAAASDSVSIRNYGNSGMNIDGTVRAEKGVLVDNKAGDAVLGGKIAVNNGNVAIMNRTTAGMLKTSANSDISTTGKLAIRNAGSKGMDLNGSLTNFKGQTAINNMAGAMDVKGSINNKSGNMGIINRGEGKMTLDADIDNNGKLKLANVKGNGFDIENSVDNKNGELDINGSVMNKDGYLYVLSRNNSKGIVTGENSVLSTDNASLAIKHTGKTNAQGKGMDLNGLIMGDLENNGQVAINNYKGDMHVGGTIMAGDDMGIINRAGGENMVVDATIAANNNITNIKNNGSGDMTVAGEIGHSGRLNVLANEGQLTLDGTITNIGNKMTYVAARAKGDGITATKNFSAESNNGLVLIKNITGSNGMDFAGSVKATNAQAELYNVKGDMTVSGSVEGVPAVILNKGNGMTITNSAYFNNDLQLVNNGSKAANAGKYQAQLIEKLK